MLVPDRRAVLMDVRGGDCDDATGAGVLVDALGERGVPSSGTARTDGDEVDCSTGMGVGELGGRDSTDVNGESDGVS